MSSFEYETAPIDEVSESSTARFKAQFDVVSAHAADLLPRASNHMIAIPSPANSSFTRVFIAEIKGWLSDGYTKFKPFLKMFQREVENQFYLQAIVGFISSVLGDLHKIRGKARRTRSIYQDLEKQMHRAVTSLVKRCDFAQHDLIQKVKQGCQIDYQLFIVIICMIAPYIIYGVTSQTSLLFNTTVKNAVAFF